jgi:hypothetical protein
MPDVGRKDGGEAAVHPIRRSSVHSVLPVSDPHVEEADAHHGRRFLKRSRLPAHLLAIHVSRSVQPSDQHFGMLLASLIIVVPVVRRLRRGRARDRRTSRSRLGIGAVKGATLAIEVHRITVRLQLIPLLNIELGIRLSALLK